MIPIEDTAHVKALGSTIVCGALTMGRAGVLGPGPTAGRKSQSNSSFVKSTFKKAGGAGRAEAGRGMAHLQGHEMPRVRPTESALTAAGLSTQ